MKRKNHAILLGWFQKRSCIGESHAYVGLRSFTKLFSTTMPKHHLLLSNTGWTSLE